MCVYNLEVLGSILVNSNLNFSYILFVLFSHVSQASPCHDARIYSLTNETLSFLTLHFILMQRHVVDFYISDFQSGLRALVKTGYGARVTPYVDDSVVIDVNPTNKDMSPEFLRWLGERNLSSDDRIMRLKEGYSTLSC